MRRYLVKIRDYTTGPKPRPRPCDVGKEVKVMNLSIAWEECPDDWSIRVYFTDGTDTMIAKRYLELLESYEEKHMERPDPVQFAANESPSPAPTPQPQLDPGAEAFALLSMDNAGNWYRFQGYCMESYRERSMFIGQAHDITDEIAQRIFSHINSDFARVMFGQTLADLRRASDEQRELCEQYLRWGSVQEGDLERYRDNRELLFMLKIWAGGYGKPDMEEMRKENADIEEGYAQANSKETD